MRVFCISALKCTSKLPHQGDAVYHWALVNVCCTSAMVDALQVQKLASVVHELQTPYQTLRCPALA